MRQVNLPPGYSLATQGKAFVFVYRDEDGAPRMSHPMPLDHIEEAARDHRDAKPDNRSR